MCVESTKSSFEQSGSDRGYKGLTINPQTTVRVPMDPGHTVNSYGTLGCRVHWTQVESEMGVIFLGSMRVNHLKGRDTDFRSLEALDLFKCI